MYIKLIAAIGKNKELGFENKLLWRITDDIQHFVEKTKGHHVIMGRKTWESIPKKFRPLIGRNNIVISRSGAHYPGEDVTVVSSKEHVLALIEQNETAWIIGGAEIYSLFIDIADELEITEIDAEKQADTFFPEFEKMFKLSKTSEKMFDKKNSVNYTFQTWQKITV